MYEKELKIAIQAARKTSEILRQAFPLTIRKFEKKGNLTANFVTKYDLLAQNHIISTLTTAFPSHSLLAEEGVNLSKQSDFQWIIDPIDGTTNFSRGFPNFASTIALSVKGEIALGVIALPANNEIYWAIRGGGAYLNGRKVQVSNTKKITRALITIGIAKRNTESLKLLTKTFQRLSYAPTKVRISGSIASDLARIAAGKLDASVFHYMNSWDVAAGILLIREAGGKVSRVHAKYQDLLMVGSNKALHSSLLKLLK